MKTFSTISAAAEDVNRFDLPALHEFAARQSLRAALIHFRLLRDLTKDAQLHAIEAMTIAVLAEFEVRHARPSTS